jgi:CHASE2 domain-containing sensor protein
MKGFFNIHNFVCTLFIFLGIALIKNIPVELEILNPIESAFDDFELTDIVFSKLQEEYPTADTNIVLVNIGKLDRAATAEEITLINRHQPKVIAIDATYSSLKDQAGDSALAAALAQVKNLVLISGLQRYNEETEEYDTLTTSHPLFNQYAETGFANFIVEDDDVYKALRSFSPKERVRGKTELAFPVKIAQLFNPEAAEKFLQRDNESEYINYKGNHEGRGFFSLDVEDVFDPEIDLSFMKDKIVLMGFMGSSFGDRTLIDKFYTPMNENYIGHSHPDMFGVVVHANSVSMILGERYINNVPEFMEIIIAVALCFLNVALFNRVIQTNGDWYDSISLVLQIIQALIIGYVVLVLFDLFSLKIDLTLALVAVLLSGNLIEIYYNLFVPLYKKRHKLNIFKPKKLNV